MEPEFGLITDLLRVHAHETPHHAAIIQDERQIDYRSLDQLVDRIASTMQHRGIGKGDVIAICSAASIDYGAVFLGALRAGIAVAPLPTSLRAESLERMLSDCGAKLAFVDRENVASFSGFSAPTTCISLDASTSDGSLAGWLLPVGAKPEPVSIRPPDPFNIIYSSGTTGVPKGIVQPHQMRWAHVQRAAGLGYDREAVALCSTPLYSNTTLVSFFPTLAGGGTVVLLPKFEATHFLRLAEKHRVTHAMLVPVQYQRIMSLVDFDRFDLSSFRMKFCTSAPFAAALKADILKRWPGGLVEYYGMTEGGGTCSLHAHLHPTKLHTVGQPVEGHDIRLIDDEGRPVERGGVGEVVGRSGAMMTGYYNQPQQTSAAEWFDAAGDRFIRTGDIGRFDADGFLILMDRKKDMIISGGFNVYPSDLESVLLSNDAVREAAVVGVPSAQWGETPVAFVVLKEGRAESAEQLRLWTNERLGKAQRLTALALMSSLPRSAIGKVLKRELRDRYLNS